MNGEIQVQKYMNEFFQFRSRRTKERNVFYYYSIDRLNIIIKKNYLYLLFYKKKNN